MAPRNCGRQRQARSFSIQLGEYLRIRIRKTQDRWRALLLTIKPAASRCLSVDELDMRDGRFDRHIDMEDQGARQALSAIQQEIDRLGVDSQLYIDTF